MIIPNINQEENTPSFEEVITKIIDSVAEEELALARLISAEAIKINAFVGDDQNFPTTPTNDEIIKFNKSIQKIIDSVMMKEWLLYKRLEIVLSLIEKVENEHLRFSDFIKELDGE